MRGVLQANCVGGAQSSGRSQKKMEDYKGIKEGGPPLPPLCREDFKHPERSWGTGVPLPKRCDTRRFARAH